MNYYIHKIKLCLSVPFLAYITELVGFPDVLYYITKKSSLVGFASLGGRFILQKFSQCGPIFKFEFACIGVVDTRRQIEYKKILFKFNIFVFRVQ